MHKPKKIKQIPKFQSEDQEREFWAKHDTTDYFDTDQPILNPVFPKLKFSTTTISLRLPVGLLDQIKALANRRDVPYQSLLKTMLADRVKEEYSV